MSSSRSPMSRKSPKAGASSWQAKGSPSPAEVETKMIRIMIDKEHKFIKDHCNISGVSFRIVNGIKHSGGEWDNFLGSSAKYGRDLYPRPYKLGPVESVILGPLNSCSEENPDECLSTMMMTVGKRGKFKYRVVAVKMTDKGEKEIRRSGLKEVNLGEPGMYTLKDKGDGPNNFELFKENQSTTNELKYYDSPKLWPQSGQWKVMDSFNPDKPSFAIRGPISGKANKMLVYFHGARGELDQEENSIFTLKCAPPGLDDEVLKDAVLLFPCSPKNRTNGASIVWLRYITKGANPKKPEEFAIDDFSEESISKAANDIRVLIDMVKEHYEVPEKNVSCYGFSNGGYAVLELSSKFPKLFKKAGCMAGHFYKDYKLVAEEFPKEVPLAIFHNVNDGVCDVDEMYKLVWEMKDKEKICSYSFTVVSNFWYAHRLTENQAMREGFINWAFNDVPEIRANEKISVLVKPPRNDKDRKEHNWDEPCLYWRYKNFLVKNDLSWLDKKYRAHYLRLQNNDYYDCEFREFKTKKKTQDTQDKTQDTQDKTQDTQDTKPRKLNKSLSPRRLKETTVSFTKTKPSEQNEDESLSPEEEGPDGWRLIQDKLDSEGEQEDEREPVKALSTSLVTEVGFW